MANRLPWRKKDPDRITLGEKAFPPGTPDEEILAFQDEVTRAFRERGIDPAIVEWEVTDG